MEVKKVAEEWEIWNEKEEVAKPEEEAKKLIPEHFHKWIHIFGKKQSKRMPTRKLWDYTIETKEGFVLKKEEGVSIVERREKRGARVHIRTIKKRVYQTLEVTSNSTGPFYKKEE